MKRTQRLQILTLALVFLAVSGCGENDGSDAGAAGPSAADGGRQHGGGPPGGGGREGRRPEGGRTPGQGGGPPGGGGWGGMGAEEQSAAVPVETAPVVRRPISSYLETNGTLEAENDVELVARTSGPIVELLVEEGLDVRTGQLLARIDPAEARARMEISRVSLVEARIAFERAEKLNESQLISQEGYERSRAAHDSAEAQFEGDSILFGYTEVKAPFDGVIVARHVKFAQTVSNNQNLFRITSFDPLLAPIHVPERELPRLKVGQQAFVTVEAWPETRFPARLLRISPVVEAATGTVKVTLEVSADGKLRPGMFASVFLETEKRPDALVIPRTALSLESIGDTVYVAAGEAASRREVELGFQEGDAVEIVAGVEEGEQVIVVGQEGLSDGTPIQVLATLEGSRLATSGPPAFPGVPPAGGPPAAARRGAGGRPGGEAAAPAAGGRPGGPPGGGRPGGGRGGFDPSNMTPEQLERMKEMMRSRGMTDEQIEERIRRMRERSQGGGGGQ